MKQVEIKIQNDDYSIIEIGVFSDLSNYSFNLPNSTFVMEGKVFVKEQLGLTSSEISVNIIEPSTSIPFIHKHRENEEIYIVTKGSGQMLLNDKTFNLKEGSIVRVSPNTERVIRNNGDKPMIYIVIQAKMNSINSNGVSDGYGIDKKPIWEL